MEKGEITPHVLDDAHRIIDLLARGLKDNEIQKELDLSPAEYSLRLKYIKESTILHDRAALAAFMSVSRMMDIRRMAMRDYLDLRSKVKKTIRKKILPDGATEPIEEIIEDVSGRVANATVGCLKIMKEIDESVVRTVLLLGIKPMPTVPVRIDRTIEDAKNLSLEDLIGKHNDKVASLH